MEDKLLQMQRQLSKMPVIPTSEKLRKRRIILERDIMKLAGEERRLNEVDLTVGIY